MVLKLAQGFVAPRHICIGTKHQIVSVALGCAHALYFAAYVWAAKRQMKCAEVQQ